MTLSDLFPPQFFLYIPKRPKIVYALTLVSATFTYGAWDLKTVEESTNLYSVIYTPGTCKIYTPLGLHKLRDPGAHVYRKHIRQHPSIMITGPEPSLSFIPVFSIATVETVFGTSILPNVKFTIIEKPDPPVAVAVAVAAGLPVPGPSPLPSPAAAGAAATLVALKNKKTGNNSELSPFVAKQLFELAVHKKDQCPVTMEEFSAGNTAVMPCGHLFMIHAIEESFKVESNKCPWCRQTGKPTFV